MKQLLLIGLIAICSFASAQDKKKLVADETTVTDSKTGFSIQTSNETIWKILITKCEDKAIRYTVYYKTDRAGRYRLYTIYFLADHKTAILSLLK